MRATGIVRRIDELGRIVLPCELRRILHINDRDPLEVFVDDDKIVLKKYEPACIFTGAADDLLEFEGRKVSKAAIKAMAKKAGLFAEEKKTETTKPEKKAVASKPEKKVEVTKPEKKAEGKKTVKKSGLNK